MESDASDSVRSLTPSPGSIPSQSPLSPYFAHDPHYNQIIIPISSGWVSSSWAG